MFDYQPKLWFQEDFKKAYSKFKEWKIVAKENNVGKMEKQIIPGFDFIWIMSNENYIISKLMVSVPYYRNDFLENIPKHSRVPKETINEDVLHRLKRQLRFVSSPEFKNSLKSKAVFDAKDLFK